MTVRHLIAVLLLSGSLLSGCTVGPGNSSVPATLAARSTGVRPGPGQWPTGLPAPPSPTATSATAPAGTAGPLRETATPETLPPVVPSSHTVATSKGPGWTSYEGINNVSDLDFAPDGSLWAATSGGLVHWDLNTQTYTRYAIPASRVAVAPDGTLWLALPHGVGRFDGVSWEVYTVADGLVGDDVWAVAVTGDGHVWVGTDRGVSRFDGQSWHSYPSPVPTHDLAVAAGGEVWAATAGGIGRYLPAEDAWLTYGESSGLPISSAQVVSAGPAGEVWAYLVWQGVYRFDGTTWQEVKGAPGPVFDMAFAADGTPWVATTGGMHYPGGGLSYRDGGVWVDVTHVQGLHSTTAVAVGPGGLVATSTQLGLGVYEGGALRLLRDGPTAQWVTSVAVTPDGAAWFGFGDHSASTPGWGLSRFDGHRWEYFLDDGEVTALTVSPDGSLWAGVGCSVQRFDGIKWETVGRCEDLPAGNILDIAFTPDGAAWVANGFGLARWDGRSWTEHDKRANSVEAAPDGTIWVNGWEGTAGSYYVAHFDGMDWTTYRAADAYPGAFSMRAVTADGLLWGTASDGRLVCFDGGSWTDAASWAFYDAPDDLSLGDMVHLTAAPDGALWVATEAAVARFDPGAPPHEAWSTYTPDQGLPAGYTPAAALAPDGAVWFGATRFQR